MYLHGKLIVTYAILPLFLMGLLISLGTFCELFLHVWDPDSSDV